MRYQPSFSIIWMGFLALSCVSASSECVPRPSCNIKSDILGPGTYQVVFVATRGSKAGHKTVGNLVLRASTPDDVSPRTGEPVAESKHHRSYGSIEFNFSEIGAPIWTDHLAPAPNSMDPVYPGVLLHEDLRGKDDVLLTIATVSNLRDDLRTRNVWRDGPGIALFVHCLTPTEFSGTWGPWGVVTDGSGHFCARRKSAD